MCFPSIWAQFWDEGGAEKTAVGTARTMLELTAVSRWAVKKRMRRRCWTNGWCGHLSPACRLQHHPADWQRAAETSWNILKEHSAASADQKPRRAVSPGRGLQVMSCSSPASHLSSSFSLSVSSSISSSWTLALMAVSSWGHKWEVRLAQSQAGSGVNATSPRIFVSTDGKDVSRINFNQFFKS